MSISKYVGRGLATTFSDLTGVTADVGQQVFVQDSGTLYTYGSSGWVQSGIKQIFNQRGMFASATNTTTENSVLGSTGIGSRTLPANFFAQDRTINFRCGGTYQTPGTPGNVTVKLKIGSTLLGSATILGTVLSSNSTTNRVFADIDIRCETSGASGVLYVDGSMGFGINLVVGSISVPLYAVADLDNAGGPVSFDTTAAGLIDITSQWTSASALQGTKATMCKIIQYT